MYADVAPDAAPADTAAGDAVSSDADTNAAMADTGGPIGPGSCLPNHDGTITRAEVTLAASLKVKWRAAGPAQIDLAGVKQADGSLAWDLSGALAGDHLLAMMTEPIAGAWYASKFANATYASRLAESADLLGVFEATDKALLLRGVVSPQAGLTQTLLTYDPPVEVLAFPLTTGQKWQRTSTVTGQAQGIPLIYYTETWSVDVDAHGTLKTPLGAFPVLRARVNLDKTVGVVTTHLRSQLFLAECYGTVAAADADTTDTAIDFTKATSVRRIDVQ
jgi:hypothetical protein